MPFAGSRVSTLALALLVGGAAGCGSDPGDKSRVGEISGTVRDQESGEHLKNAKIVFTSDTLDRGETKTNEHGAFTLLVDSRVPNGRVQASKSGYTSRMVSVYLDSTDVHVEVDLTRAR